MIEQIAQTKEGKKTPRMKQTSTKQKESSSKKGKQNKEKMEVREVKSSLVITEDILVKDQSTLGGKRTPYKSPKKPAQK